MNLDIGAQRSVDGDKVFLVGRCFSKAEPPFVLLYDATKAQRAKRNIQKVDPTEIISVLGEENFVRVDAPHWRTVWIRTSTIRGVRQIPANSLVTCEVGFGSYVLFKHDPEPPDEHAGFLLYGMQVEHAARLLNQPVGK